MEQAEGDTDLYSVIKIGAHTGMRREEICDLTVGPVGTDDGVRYLKNVGDRTISGLGNVQIPPHHRFTDR